MALHLRRIIWPYEAMKCDVTKKILSYGDYYYEDDTDGLIVDADYYHRRKQAEKLEEAARELPYAYDPETYRIKMRQAERDFLELTLMDREVCNPRNTHTIKDGDR